MLEETIAQLKAGISMDDAPDQWSPTIAVGARLSSRIAMCPTSMSA